MVFGKKDKSKNIDSKNLENKSNDDSNTNSVASSAESPQKKFSFKSKNKKTTLGKSNKSRYPLYKNSWISFFNGVFTILLVVAIGLMFLISYAKNEFEKQGPLTVEKNVIIPKASRLRSISTILERHNIVNNGNFFLIGVMLNNAEKKLKAGEFNFKPGLSMHEVMDILIEGKVVQHPITIPEGLTSQQIVGLLLDNDLLRGSVESIPNEGSLLPDTYYMVRGTDRSEVIKRMAEAQNKLVDEIWNKRDKNIPIESKEDLITLASIVEKETGVDGERAKVASVFINRIRKKMRLQSDPTIIYGIVGGRGRLGRPISRADINLKTDYNTYQIDGLPPTPIANPGKAALEAVANPEETDYLFFVADGTGGHAFSKTLKEHNANVAKWREIERQQKNQNP